MCEICNKIKGLDTKQALNEVAKAMRARKPDMLHLSEVLDVLIKIPKPEEQDPELAEIWEKMRRE
jgi:hypothetical protein